MTRRVGFGGDAPRRRGAREIGALSAPPKSAPPAKAQTPSAGPETTSSRMRPARLLARTAVLAGFALVVALLALVVAEGVRSGEPGDDGETLAAGLALVAATIGWLAMLRALLRDLLRR